MNKLRLANTTTTLAIALALFMLTGCQKEEVQPLTADEKIVAPNEHVRDRLKKYSNVNSHAMDQAHSEEPTVAEDIGENMKAVIFDGSSEKTFRDGLEKFQSLANPNEVRALNSAITYLKVYDLSARGNTEKLFQALDGLTPEQIVQRADQIRN